jgi:hypothetical protein
MPTLQQKQQRADQARINGAKSTGPKTPEGLKSAQTATLTHGLYATEATLKASIDPDAFETMRQKYHRIWQPADEYTAERVDELALIRWDLNRLQLVRRNEITELFAQTNSVIDTEIHASKPGSVIERLDARIRKQQLALSRLEKDILRLKKELPPAGPSHNPLQTNISTGPCYQETPYEENPNPGNQPMPTPEQSENGGPPAPKMPDTAPRT